MNCLQEGYKYSSLLLLVIEGRIWEKIIKVINYAAQNYFNLHTRILTSLRKQESLLVSF